jgi:HAD superfamily hydrolase (TIGR01509 family)
VIKLAAIIFGGIGTLVETSHLQYDAFNDAFVALDIDFRWDFLDYKKSLASSGGTNRLSQLKLADGSALSESQIRNLHETKTRLYADRLAKVQLPLRAGVAELIENANAGRVRLAWATTTSKININALIGATNGAIRRDMFAFIGNDTFVSAQKPDPQIYQLCLTALGIGARQALAIEDSVIGVQAAKAAGLYTIGFPGAFQIDKNLILADATLSDVASALTLFQ